jgi:hypothetical protein
MGKFQKGNFFRMGHISKVSISEFRIFGGHIPNFIIFGISGMGGKIKWLGGK